MAKVTAPLFGFGATGQIGKSVVYFPWKGIKAARQYVVPGNPRTSGQVAQREFFKDGVALWHDPGTSTLQQVDIEAWNRYAGTLGPMSGFNAFLKPYIAERVAGGHPVNNFTAFEVDDASEGNLGWTVQTGLAGTPFASAFWGRTPTSQPNQDSKMIAAGAAVYSALDGGLRAGDTCYVYFSTGSEGSGYFRSGLYSFKVTS